MHTLTAFEFVGAHDRPQQIVLKRQGAVVASFVAVTWFGALLDLAFDQPADLSIEGEGLGKPYWNGELPVWASAFDAAQQARNIAAIRAAAMREVNRVLISQ